MAITVQGNSGALRLGGRQAAGLGRWSLRTVAPDAGGGYELTAPLVGPDRYWLERGGPFELRLTLSHCTWRWRNITPTLDANYRTLTARVDTPPEEV